jgi:PAS domain S-box-containing protein
VGLAALGAAGVALTGVAVWVALTGAGAEPRGSSAAVHALVIAAPFAAGLYAVYRNPGARFGWLLVLAGVLWSPTMLAESADSVLYSIGRVSVWFAELLLIYLVLAFPTGRLSSRTDRLLVRAGAVIVALYVVYALLGDYPEPSPWATCGTDCPDNAFMLPSSEPGFVGAALLPALQLASVVVFAGVALQLLRRLMKGTSLMRVELVPVLAAAVVRMAATVAFLIAREADSGSQLTEVLGWIALLATPAVSVGFLIGLVGSRVRAARALSKLSVLGRPTAQQLRDVIAQAVDDPSLEVVYRTSGDPAEWVDDVGHPVALPEAPDGRATTEIRTAGLPVAALIHDPALVGAPVITEVAKGFTQMALQNQRLETELRSSLRELQASRSRIMSAADEERRRIERDLHDGAQQRLLALAIELEMAGDLVASNPGEGAQRLHELVEDVNEAMADIRSLASGLYPSLLLERGLVEALSAVAAGGSVPTTLTAESLGRYAPEIEGAVYFCCREALQNAAKHAQGGSVLIKLWEAKAEAVHFEVRDDGVGLPQGHGSKGAGITNMRDRIGAMGGTLAIESHPGAGTCVMGAVPLAPAAVPLPIDSLLRRATDALPDCLAIYRAVTDARGNVADFAVEHMNDAARRDLGVGARDPVGQTLGQLHPDSVRSRAFRWLRHIVELEVSRDREDTAYEPLEGDRRRLMQSSELRAVPLGGGRVVVVWRDVTEHARADDDLRLQSTVLRRTPEAICLIRASDSVIVYTNQRFAELMGYELGELDGRSVTEINWEDDPGHAELVAEQIKADLEGRGEARYELRNRRKDGTLIWCEAHVAGFDHPDHGRVWVCVHQDVTSKREARSRLSRGNGHRLGARWSANRRGDF